MTNKKIPALKLIYHYCSIESFLSIIQNSELYLSTTKYMNDYMESKWLSGQIKTVLKQKSRHLTDFYISTIRRLISQYQSGIHIACFSSHHDLLSQWRGYADNGSGIAIGFDPKMLGTFSDQTVSTKILSLNQVVYDQEQQNQLILKILTKLSSDLKKISSQDHISSNLIRGIFERVKLKDVLESNNSFSEENQLVITYTQVLMVLSFLFKNHAFHEEGEYRLCYFQDFTFLDAPITNNNISLGDADCYAKNGKIKTYYPLKLNNKSIIKEVILGPKCQTDKETVRFALKKFGFNNASVFKSEASYR